METQITPPEELTPTDEKAATLECVHRLALASCYGRPEAIGTAVQHKTMEIIGMFVLLTGATDKDTGEKHESPFLKHDKPLPPMLEKLLEKKREQLANKCVSMLTGHLMALAANLDLEAMKAGNKPCGEEGCTCHITQATALETLSLFKQYVLGQHAAGKIGIL